MDRSSRRTALACLLDLSGNHWSLKDHDAVIASIANSSQGLSELAIGEFRGINHEI